MTMQIYPDLIPIFLQRIHGFCAFLTHSFAKLHLINFVWNFDYNFRCFGRNYRKNYRKPIYRHLFNYRQNYRYRSKTSTNYRRFQGIIGKVIDIENYRRIIENLSLSKKMTYRSPLQTALALIAALAAFPYYKLTLVPAQPTRPSPR